MRKSTIKLTKHELDFASDTIYPETKQSVMLKMRELFAECGQKLNQNVLYQELTQNGQFKITKGEQYKGLPYLVLDCPQIKGSDFDWVARTMFWWGHYISCNLIIRTDMLEPKKQASALHQLKKTRILTGHNLWEQELESDAYSKLSDLSIVDITHILQDNTYLKISRKIALRKHARLPEITNIIYSEWFTALGIKKGAD
ncbi:MAG: hypothetical protein V4651_08325 [Bacteroidota bacterium]